MLKKAAVIFWIRSSLVFAIFLPNIVYSQSFQDKEVCVSISDNEVVQEDFEDIVIRYIEIITHQIFDENKDKESGSFYQWVNKVHYTTEEKVIRKDLLFSSGDKYNKEKIKESERLLRSRKYFWDATITVIRKCGNSVDLRVTTRDVWTLHPTINFSRKGGENKKALGFSDSNFLGTGKAIEIAKFENIERAGYLFGYQDPEVFKDHWALNISYADNSDGFSHFVRLNRPFYALDTQWQAGVLALNSKLKNQLYFRGEIVDEFSQRVKRMDIVGGTSSGFNDGQAFRTQYGFNYSKNNFSNISGIFNNSLLPEDRIFSYPWIGFEYIENNFLELQNINKIGKTEDINLGWRVRGSVGYSSTVLGADMDRWIVSSNASKYFMDAMDNLWNWKISLAGNYADNQIENAVLHSSIKMYSRQSSWSSFYLALDATLAENLYRDKQLTLGGDSGLRGYPLKYQTGNQRLLMKIEQRFYTNWEPFQLFNVGAAAFVDIGRAWFSDKNNGLVDPSILKNIGIGLRLSSTRTGQNNVIHLDLATPLDAEGDVSGLQWLVSVKSTF